MTGRENLAYTAKLTGMSRELAKERIAAALEKVRLSAPADRPVSTYSRGMRQHLGIAELQIRECKVAILDEPASIRNRLRSCSCSFSTCRAEA